MSPIQDPIRPTTPEAVRLARSLMRSARHGAIAVLDARTGRPLASRVTVATDGDGTPLILVSGLANHTPALRAHPACSLLLGEPGKGDPLAYPRITLHCEAQAIEKASGDYPRARRRYLNHNPKGALYVDLGDFAFFRLNVLGASLNGGFGKAFNLSSGDLLCPRSVCDMIAACEQEILDTLNASGMDRVAAHMKQTGQPLRHPWKATGFDPDGIDIAHGDEIARLIFPDTSATLQDALAALSKVGVKIH